MKTITNDREYRMGYEVLGMMQETVARDGMNIDRWRHITSLKRNLRQYAHRDTRFDRQIIKDEGMDGFISLDRLPDHIRSMDEAQRYFDDNMKIHCRPSIYDCTGQPFTSWFKVFQRRGRYYAYHSVCFDV